MEPITLEGILGRNLGQVTILGYNETEYEALTTNACKNREDEITSPGFDGDIRRLLQDAFSTSEDIE